MTQYSNFDRVMESKNHFKNGASSKTLMSRENLHILFFGAMILSFSIISCDKNDEPISEREMFLVDKIFDYNNNLVAEYFYDNYYRLIKKSVTEHLGNDFKQEWTAYTDEFEYLNGRVSKIIRKDVTYNMFNYDTYIFYNSLGQLIKSEIHSLGLVDYSEFYYSQNGHVDSVYYYYAGYSYNLWSSVVPIYNNAINVIKSINTFPNVDYQMQPIPGVTIIENHCKYDNNLKPNFGIDYLFIYDPLPFRELGDLERCLSNNNMIEYFDANNWSSWSYTYSKNGLPSTIEVKWEDIETDEPMILRISYKQLK